MLAPKPLPVRSAFAATQSNPAIRFPAELEIALYREMARIRCIEETLADLYREGQMRTPTHFGIGQEAVAVGVCAALRREDVVYSHHRCHAHYLAKGGDLLGLVAELYGRERGCSRGRGGSVHLTDRRVGFIGSSPILGQSIALATGSALAIKMDKHDHVAVSFFGEGACEEGITYEAFNYAAIKQLPVLFVCENNFYSTETPLSVRQPEGTQLCERAETFKLRARKIDGNDVAAVHAATIAALDHLRSGRGPFFLECETYRWREHVGPMFDHELNRTYRTRAEVEDWKERCPVKRGARRLLDFGFASVKDIEVWNTEIQLEVAGAVNQAKASPWPDVSTLFENIY
jgi:TPP-dependent pyruvate/acetoin dehydrogenase alpha subunit